MGADRSTGFAHTCAETPQHIPALDALKTRLLLDGLDRSAGNSTGRAAQRTIFPLNLHVAALAAPLGDNPGLNLVLLRNRPCHLSRKRASFVRITSYVDMYRLRMPLKRERSSLQCLLSHSQDSIALGALPLEILQQIGSHLTTKQRCEES